MIIARLVWQFVAKKYVEITHFNLILKTFCLFVAYCSNIQQNHALSKVENSTLAKYFHCDCNLSEKPMICTLM